MRIAVIGGTSAIAEHCCRLWVARPPADITLVVRDATRGERIAADLRVRNPQAKVSVVAADFLAADAIAATVDSIVAGGAVDIALIAHGVLPDQATVQDDLQACRDALEINAVSPALFAEAFARHFAAAGRGTLAIIGSVAGDRGRKSNYVYGAAKGLVERYAEGLQHRFARSGVRVVLVKPGPTDTPMTGHMKAQGRGLAPVREVAAAIVKAIDRGAPLVYAPRRWQLVMLAIRNIPRALFNRLEI